MCAYTHIDRHSVVCRYMFNNTTFSEKGSNANALLCSIVDSQQKDSHHGRLSLQMCCHSIVGKRCAQSALTLKQTSSSPCILHPHIPFNL